MSTDIVDNSGHISFAPIARPEEQSFVLSSSQLQTIIQEATEPLKQEIKQLWESIDKLALDAAYNSQRVKKLEVRENYPKTPTSEGDEERAIKIKGLINERLSISFAELRGLLHVSRVLLWRSICILLKENPGEYAIKKDSSDKRARTLIRLPVIK